MKNLFTAFSLVILGLAPLSTFAFRPIGHVILKNEVVDSLPVKNMFRIAMQQYPQIAAWGAVGPDLGYNLDNSRILWIGWKRRIKNSWQLADVSHYNKVGTFVKNLIAEVKKVNDPKFTAFVGGWITHIAGDFGSHSTYVKPEAGFYICNEEGRALHGELEKLADAYLFNKYASKYCLSSWNFQVGDYWQYFFGVPHRADNLLSKKQVRNLTSELLGDSLTAQFTRVYSATYELKTNLRLVRLMSTYYRALGEGLGKQAGFTPYGIIEALGKIDKDREERINKAFELSKEYAYKYLVAADAGDLSVFSDDWNLDIGPDGGPTYVVKIEARKRIAARTKNNIYMQFVNNNGMESPRQLLNTKIAFMRFAFYQKDPYYYHVNMGGGRGELHCWGKEDIKSISLISMRRPGTFSNVFRIKKITVYYNGEIISTMEKDKKGRKLKLKKTMEIYPK
ncbi:MAG: Phospholipase family protein [Bacteroidetes bacterium]|nr:Phospholipase family protein [Bacteroidota bacterium]